MLYSYAWYKHQTVQTYGGSMFISKLCVSAICFCAFSLSVAYASDENQHIPQDCKTGLVTFASNSIVTSDLEHLVELIRPCVLVEQENRKPFTIVIAGNGGDVGAMTALYDMVATSEGRAMITTRGVGSLASATIPLFMMGTKREIGPNTQFLFHQIRSYDEGSATTRDIRESTNFNAAAIEQYVAIIVKNSKLSADQIRSFMDESRVVTATEAITMGLAGSILTEN